MNTESVTRPLLLMFFIASAIGFTALGVVAGIESVRYFDASEMLTALWLAVFGVASLYVGLYGIGYRRLLARIV